MGFCCTVLSASICWKISIIKCFWKLKNLFSRSPGSTRSGQSLWWTLLIVYLTSLFSWLFPKRIPNSIQMPTIPHTALWLKSRWTYPLIGLSRTEQARSSHQRLVLEGHGCKERCPGSSEKVPSRRASGRSTSLLLGGSRWPQMPPAAVLHPRGKPASGRSYRAEPWSREMEKTWVLSCWNKQPWGPPSLWTRCDMI